MAYTKNTWQTGDIVTSAKLNNMENGIANAGVFWIGIDRTGDNPKLNKKWSEINTALQNGQLPYILDNQDDSYSIIAVTSFGVADGVYYLDCTADGYVTDNPEGYPELYTE